MLKSIEVTGKTENDALASALKQLGMDRDSVSFEVIERAKTGFLGIGSHPARIKVTYEAPDEPAPAPAEEAPAPQPQETQEPEEVSAPAPAEEEAAPAEEPAKPKKSRRRKKKPQAPKEEKRAEAPEAQPEQKAEPAAPAEDRSESICAFLTGLMERLEVEATPRINAVEGNIYQVELVGEELGALIGRRGETLDAIQQLTNYAVNNGKAQRVRVHIDAEHYRAKREESLQRLARKTAGKAIKYRRNMMLEPMNAYERHVIHAALQDYDPAISTYSTGTEPNRRIVVAYDRSVR